MSENLVQIPLEKLIELVRKSEQRDSIIRFLKAENYVNKKEVFTICDEALPAKEE